MNIGWILDRADICFLTAAEEYLLHVYVISPNTLNNHYLKELCFS